MKTRDSKLAVISDRTKTGGGQGFSLIELLVVISIIGVLAGLVVALSGTASARSKEARTRAEMTRLITAINAYKAHYGFYPPDNPGYPSTNTLYYELSGTQRTGGAIKSFNTLDNAEKITGTTLKSFFNTDGFLNSNEDVKEVKKFASFSDAQHKEISPNPDVEVLIAPVPWDPKYGTPPMANFNGLNNTTINPWRYVSTSPTNNSTGFDLWVEYYVGGKSKIISNW